MTRVRSALPPAPPDAPPDAPQIVTSHGIAVPTPGAGGAPLPMSTEQGAAFVPRAGGPPDTSGYMTAGYIVAFVLYAAYLGSIARRMARVRLGA